MNLNNAILEKVSTHYVGNKNNEQELILSAQPVELDERLTEKLKDYFLGKITQVHERFQFTHDYSLDHNEVYCFVKEIFENPAVFHDMSSQIAEHLYDIADHHNIKSGELHLCHFSNCFLNQEKTEVIGIFKTEVKSGFFEVNQSEQKFTINYKEGIDLNKFDKGCLVFNKNKEDGYEVVIYNSQGRGEESKYWKDDFLNLQHKNNEFHQTSQVLGMAKQFITNHITEEFEIPKTDQIDMLNKSAGYFKSHHEFDKDEFAAEVFPNEDIVQSFRSFDHTYREEKALAPEERFEISPEAVKKQAKIFKSVLKLDKNFHIYIHGNRKLIEKGTEDNGKKFYKIYYDEEK